jgi:hypothetical protein
VPIEGHDGGREVVAVGDVEQFADDRPVALVNTVELADGDGRGAEVGRKLGDRREDLHDLLGSVDEAAAWLDAGTGLFFESQIMPRNGSTSGTNR